jgi:hypothetical protein
MTSERLIWGGVALGVAGLAGMAARRSMEVGWRALAGSKPPRNPAAWSVSWPEAIAWTAASGLVVGFARLFAERGAVAGYARLTGRMPPV